MLKTSRISKSDITQSADFTSSIGRVAIQSAHLEATIRDLIEQIIRGNGTPCVTSDLTFANLHHLAKALGHRLIKSNRQLERYNEMMGRAKAAYDDRNKIIHSGWMDHDYSWTNGEYEPSKFVAIRFRAKGKLIIQGEIWTAAEIESVASAIHASMQEIGRYMDQKRFRNLAMFDESAGARRLRAAGRKSPNGHPRSQARKKRANPRKPQPLA